VNAGARQAERMANRRSERIADSMWLLLGVRGFACGRLVG
jgi:hypothetical protein